MRKKVLLGHLNSMGDCLLATVVARQIKEVDYPDCHLTWAVNSKCKQAVLLNPHVDEIWEIPTEKSLVNKSEWDSFLLEADNKKKIGEFDFLFIIQIYSENWLNYDGGIRSSIYNNYPHKITVPHQPIIQLADDEVENVRQFAERHQLNKYKQVVLVECGPDSFDTALNSQSAYDLALDITLEDNDIAFILSSNKKITSSHPNIMDASGLSFRENAELAKYCDLLVGCASGISWLTVTNWSKKLNMILVIKDDNIAFPSMIYDHEYLRLPTDHIIEIKDNANSVKSIKDCLSKVIISGFTDAKKAFNKRIYLTNYFFLEYQINTALVGLNFKRCSFCLRRYIKRNGINIVTVSAVLNQSKNIILNLARRVKNQLSKRLGLNRKQII